MSGPALRIAPPDFVGTPGLQAVLKALPRARLVGGCVRDTLAGVPVADIDLAAPLPPEQVLNALAAADLRAIPTGLSHGTVTAIAHGESFEITSLRRDLETDGRHATVVWTDDWVADAARRDFTINAMSMTADGSVHDPFGGLADLRAGRVRFVGDPATRIAEDYLRILRYFRFYARYGNQIVDSKTMQAIIAGVKGIPLLSVERVWAELKRILAAPDPAASVALMMQSGVLDTVITEGADPARLAALIARGAPPDPLLRLAALLIGDAANLAARLRLSCAETERLVALRAGPVLTPTADDASMRRALAETPADILVGRLWLTGADAASRERLAAMPRPVFALQGRDARALGMPPGPAIGAVLRDVRAWWLAGGCVADAASCRAELARRIAR